MIAMDALPACHYYSVQAPDKRFDIAIVYVLNHEGKLTEDKSDPGGITNYGISIRFLKDEDLDIDRTGIIASQDVKDLSLTCAKSLYKEFFWDKYHYNQINDLGIAKKIFDISVNMGPAQAHKLTKRALNYCRHYKVPIDGTLNAVTIDIINGLDPLQLLDAIRRQENIFYVNLVHDNPKLDKFLKGWLNRAAE